MRGGFNRVLYNNIKDVQNVDDLACKLSEDKTLMNFAKTIFWDILSKIKTIIPDRDKFTEFVKPKMLFNIKELSADEKILENIGYSDDQVNAIIETVFNANGKTRFMMSTNLPFLDPTKDSFSAHTLTRMLTALNNPECQSLYIRNDQELFERFIVELRQHYNLPNEFSKETFTEIYNQKTADAENGNNYKKSFDMLVTKLLHMSDNYESIIQQNYGREAFARQNKDRNAQKTARDFPRCFTNLSNSGANKIHGIENFLELKGTFTKAIFEHYGKQAVGGVSGSSYYLYFLIFKILRYSRDEVENFSKVLCLCILDYVPLWHNLEEILLTFSIEFEKSQHDKIKVRYYLNQNALQYFKDFLQKFSDPPMLRSQSEPLDNSFDDNINLVRSTSVSGGKKKNTRRKRKKKSRKRRTRKKKNRR
tara:strand:+ start:3083 stop:4345 length:1263 start_codon:yes stop_codon:yes gene_type:complete